MTQDIYKNINLNNISKKIIITNSNNSKNIIGTTIIYNLTSFKKFLDEEDILETKLNSNRISLNDMIYSNKIILSARIENSNKYVKNISLLSQHNILNNIAYYYKNNNLDNPNPRIIFKKSYLNNISNNNKLLNVNNDEIMKFNILNQEFDINILSQSSYRYIIEKNIHITLNYYKNYDNSNYYKINLKDFFLNKKISDTNNVNTLINSIDILDISINNNFLLNNNYNIDNSTLSTIFCISNNIVSKLSSFKNILETSYNLLLFNIAENLTSFKLKYYNSNSEQILLDSSKTNITFITKKFPFSSKTSLISILLLRSFKFNKLVIYIISL